MGLLIKNLLALTILAESQGKPDDQSNVYVPAGNPAYDQILEPADEHYWIWRPWSRLPADSLVKGDYDDKRTMWPGFPQI